MENNLGLFSYNEIVTDQNIYLIFVDNVKNMDIAKDDVPKYYYKKSAVLTSTKIDYETGEVSKQKLFDMDHLKGIRIKKYDNNRIVKIQNDEIAVEVRKKKNEDIWIRMKASDTP